MLPLPRCLNNLAEFIQLRLHVRFFVPFFLIICTLFDVMCLTPRNRFEYVDKLQRTQNYTTYNVEIDACDYLDIDEKIACCNADLTIVQLNIRGLYSKQHKLRGLYSKQHKLNELIMENFSGKNPDIILLCETWQSKTSPILDIKGYSIVQKHREHRKGGGVSILISENLKYRTRPDLECTTSILEHCVVEIKLATENLLCSSCYRAPNTNTELFLTEYESLLNRLKTSSSKIIMGMDHNLDLLKYSKHRPTRDFISVNENMNLIPSITRPTRITNSSAMLIDNIFVHSDFVRSLRSKILINDISDHLPSCIVIENINIGSKDKKIVTRKLNESKMKLIKKELQNVNWENCTTKNGDINYLFENVHARICESINKHAPLREEIVNVGKLRHEPWMTSGLKRSSQKL